MINADDRATRPIPRQPERKLGDDSGPSKPNVERPGGNDELLKRLRKVDPDQAKRYRQRSGQ
ncbi:MAG: ubiquitin-like protein UBact [Fimbriimonadaceae bacterium]